MEERQSSMCIYQSTTMERPDLERIMEQVLPYGKSITGKQDKLFSYTIMHKSEITECYFFLRLLHQNSFLVFVKKKNTGLHYYCATINSIPLHNIYVQ
jgi:hypothetical protein